MLITPASHSCLAGFSTAVMAATEPSASARMPTGSFRCWSIDRPSRAACSQIASTRTQSTAAAPDSPELARIAWPIPYPCCGPHCSVCRTNQIEGALQKRNPVLVALCLSNVGLLDASGCGRAVFTQVAAENPGVWLRQNGISSFKTYT
jgi:hypothetical protein